LVACKGHVNFILANAFIKIKHIPGRKTDTLDSEWIAKLCLTVQAKSSFILIDILKSRWKGLYLRVKAKKGSKSG